MTKNYEKLFSSCQTLSELLYLPMPSLSNQIAKMDSIGLSSSSMVTGANGMIMQDGQEDANALLNKWEDEEERRFYEDVLDLREFVPRSFIGLEEGAGSGGGGTSGAVGAAGGVGATEGGDEKDKEKREKERMTLEAVVDVKKLEEELNALKLSEMDESGNLNGNADMNATVNLNGSVPAIAISGDRSAEEDDNDDDG